MNATLTGTEIASASSLKPKHYKRHARRGVAEAMLGRAVIVAEGVTEHSALQAVAERLESLDSANWPLDLAGVTIFSVDGDGDIPTFGGFFQALGLRTFAFYDRKSRSPQKNAEFAANFDIPLEKTFDSIEKLLLEETPPDIHWKMLESIRNAGGTGNLLIPVQRPAAAALSTLILSALKSNKGNGYAAQLIDLCSFSELPTTIVTFLLAIYAFFPRPTKPTVLPPVQPAASTAATPSATSRGAATPPSPTSPSP